MTDLPYVPAADAPAPVNEQLTQLAWLVPDTDSATSRLSAAEALFASVLLTTQFVCLYDYPAQELVFVSAGVQQVLGEQPAAEALTTEWLAARLHPADAPPVAQAQALLGRYLQARPAQCPPGLLFSLDYRLRHANGTYRRILHECLLLEQQHGAGFGLRTVHVFTDITHHKLTHEVRFHVNQPDFSDFIAPSQRKVPTLSSREQQILVLVLQGHTSKQIAYQLGIRESTVKAHRRNLLRKTATHNFHELLRHLAPASPQSTGRG